jgi:hypothetical protein
MPASDFELTDLITTRVSTISVSPSKVVKETCGGLCE